MKKRIIYTVIFIFIICSTVLFYKPSYIVNSPEHVDGISIFLNTGNAEVVELTDFDKTAVAEFLSTCKQQRAFFVQQRVFMDDVKLEIYVHETGQNIHIFLGNVNYNDSGNIYKYRIINADSVLQTLYKLLEITPDAEDGTGKPE